MNIQGVGVMVRREKIFRGDRLQDLREKRGLTQDDLATRTKIGQRQVYKYEKNIVDPSLRNLRKLADELECSVEYLLGLVDTPQKQLSISDLAEDEVRLIYLIRDKRVKPAISLLLDQVDTKDQDD